MGNGGVAGSRCTRYFVASSYEHVQMLSQLELPRLEAPGSKTEFILKNFKEVHPDDLTTGEWQFLLMSGLVVGVDDNVDIDAAGISSTT